MDFTVHAELYYKLVFNSDSDRSLLWSVLLIKCGSVKFIEQILFQVDQTPGIISSRILLPA